MAAKTKTEISAVLEVYRYLSAIHAVALTALRAKGNKELTERINGTKGVLKILKQTLADLEEWRKKNSRTESPLPTPEADTETSGMKALSLSKPLECGGRCREPTPYCCNNTCFSEPC